MMLRIVECRTFPIQTFTHLIFILFFNCILFADYCVLPLHVHGCALIKKYDDDDAKTC